MSPPHRLDPEFKRALLALADKVEARLGLSDTPIAIVVHHKSGPVDAPAYEVSIGCDGSPAFLKALRSCFPARRTGPCSVRMGRLGGVDFVNVRLTDIEAALGRG